MIQSLMLSIQFKSKMKHQFYKAIERKHLYPNFFVSLLPSCGNKWFIIITGKAIFIIKRRRFYENH